MTRRPLQLRLIFYFEGKGGRGVVTDELNGSMDLALPEARGCRNQIKIITTRGKWGNMVRSYSHRTAACDAIWQKRLLELRPLARGMPGSAAGVPYRDMNLLVSGGRERAVWFKAESGGHSRSPDDQSRSDSFPSWGKMIVRRLLFLLPPKKGTREDGIYGTFPSFRAHVLAGRFFLWCVSFVFLLVPSCLSRAWGELGN